MIWRVSGRKIGFLRNSTAALNPRASRRVSSVPDSAAHGTRKNLIVKFYSYSVILRLATALLQSENGGAGEAGSWNRSLVIKPCLPYRQ